MKTDYKVIGVMAGSSMDGLDVVCVEFNKGDKWEFDIKYSRTLEYDSAILGKLRISESLALDEQQELDRTFGEWIAKQLKQLDLTGVELIAVHGHTIIHKPKEAISWQLGQGEVIANETGIMVISDFRSEDVSLGGQGAPLVPKGDFDLFEDYDGCLNLGGIANLSIRSKKMAWDVCPCNQVLNYYSNQLGITFDDRGKLASQGDFNEAWFKDILSDSFFAMQPPKSLPNNFIDEKALEKLSPKEGLRTYTEIISNLIKRDVSHLDAESKILITGGGAYNDFLISLLISRSKLNFVVPDKDLVEFKEALIFAYLGILRVRKEVNVLGSVTGARRDTSSGTIHYPK